MKSLTAKGIEARNEIVADMVKAVGAEKAEAWMTDAGKLQIINALAAAVAK